MKPYERSNIKGATMIEYVLLASLVGAAAVVLLTALGTSVGTVITNITTALTG